MPNTPQVNPVLDSGTYEIIRNRLNEQRQELVQRLAKLNTARKEIFNSTGFSLIANQRITTENNGVARGIIAFGERCIFAYNVHFGLRDDIQLSDVFSVYRFTNNHFEADSLTLINDETFITDFTNLYKYYRDSIFAKFTRTENYLYMIFQTSKKAEDRKAFKWLVKDNQLTYVDDRSIHEVKTAPQHDFKWIRTGLEDRRLGVHPHISVLNKVFIEAVGGDITFKIEDNTQTGKGIYAEAVLNKDQQLDDAEYYYADLGNLIAIRIKPYQEGFRTFIFNVRTKEVQPITMLQDAGILLPDNQGVIFPNGYYLQNGDYKIFESDLSGLDFMRRIPSPNGEDFLYIFYERNINTYVLMSYNVILQQVETPIICNGFTVFDDGKLIYFRSEKEAVRHHQVQIWQTPYTAVLKENKAMADNVLYKIGNKDIVSVMAESQEIIQLLQKEDSYEGLYEDIYKKANDTIDAYFWLKDENAFSLAAPLEHIRDIANTAIDEFAKVQAQRQFAVKSLADMTQQVNELVIKVKNTKAESLDELVQLLTTLRGRQGAIIDLLNIRYINTDAVHALKDTLQEYNLSLSQHTISFLLREEALQPYEVKVAEQKANVGLVTKVIDAQAIEQAVKAIAGELEMLIDILNSLKIEDSTQATQIIERISLIFASLNEVRADLVRTTTALKSREATGEFHAQLTLLEQSIVNFLDLSDTPEKCEDYFTKVSVQVEELESKFADFDEFVLKIADKRDEVIKAFNGKKEMLVEQMNRRTASLEQIGLRILKNVENKAQSLENKEIIYAFFSTDLMIDKIRSLVEELRTLGDVAKAENLENLLKVAQENAVRSLKDKTELFADGKNIISLGTYKFAVNKQVLNLIIVRRDNKLFYHLQGTGFYKEVIAEELYRYHQVWEQELISENSNVYRAEYLAFEAYQAAKENASEFNAEVFINNKTERDYAAAYLKGVHNADALMIYTALVNIENELGVLCYEPNVRVAAQLFWFSLSEEVKAKLSQLIQAAYAIQQSFPDNNRFEFVEAEIAALYKSASIVYKPVDSKKVAAYLYKEFSKQTHFTCSQQAVELKKNFIQFLKNEKRIHLLEKELDNKHFSTDEKFFLLQNWLIAYQQNAPDNNNSASAYIDEAICLILFATHHYVVRNATDTLWAKPLKGTHPVIKEQEIIVNYHDFLYKMEHYFAVDVPAYRAFNLEKEQLTNQYRQGLKINEFEPKVLSSFVRNKLINEVYFPLIGANLAKQIGAAGDDKRTARMGMLLLVSPPGYGKTTLMEYLAKIMGLHFVKVNGPTIGHNITSIDPVEATTSGAREELKKINLSFEMADNVMLYLDDIQHCSPEFLQKFISLADGQRKMDGIFEGVSKTYDLRGKRFCVVMAGNPYTESGEQFKIPDMLANRADVYNLGDVIGNTAHLFNLSLIENAIQENTYLQRVAAKSMDDLYKLINYVENADDMLPDLEGNYNGQEVEDAIAVLRNVVLVREIVVKVNQQYIASAAMKDAYRTEPPFKLQGSYRNMNKMAGKVVPLMNLEEMKTLVLSHYEGEVQTLTSDAEANLLKLKELAGFISMPETQRWDSIKEIFRRNNQYSGMEEGDATGKVLVQLSNFNDQLKAIASAIKG